MNNSRDFDLEAHIASLPVCDIDFGDRRAAAKVKARSQSCLNNGVRHQESDVRQLDSEYIDDHMKGIYI